MSHLKFYPPLDGPYNPYSIPFVGRDLNQITRDWTVYVDNTKIKLKTSAGLDEVLAVMNKSLSNLTACMYHSSQLYVGLCWSDGVADILHYDFVTKQFNLVHSFIGCTSLQLFFHRNVDQANIKVYTTTEDSLRKYTFDPRSVTFNLEDVAKGDYSAKTLGRVGLTTSRRLAVEIVVPVIKDGKERSWR